MRPRFTLLVCITLVMGSFICSAVAGSIYSTRGIGLVRYFVSARSSGMGGVGLANVDKLTVSYLNPAALAAIPLTTISGTFLHEAADLKGSFQNATITDSNIFGVQFVVPLKQNRAALAIGVNPYSSIEYSFTDTNPGENSSTETVVGDGGVNTAFLSFALRPFKNLYLGATGLFYFGVIRNVHRVDFESSEFLDVRSEVSQSFTEGNIRFGFIYTVLPGWSIGGVFTPSVTLNADQTATLQAVGEFSDLPDRKIQIPIAFGGGTSLVLAKKLRVGVDFYMQHWSDFADEGFVNNSKRFGLGIEFSAKGTFRDPYLSRVAYRAGLFYRDLGLEEPEGEKVTELFGSVGLGLPIKWTAARIDLALEVGRRGSVSNNPFRETVIRVTGSITVGNRWFYRGGGR